MKTPLLILGILLAFSMSACDGSSSFSDAEVTASSSPAVVWCHKETIPWPDWKVYDEEFISAAAGTQNGRIIVTTNGQSYKEGNMSGDVSIDGVYYGSFGLGNHWESNSVDIIEFELDYTDVVRIEMFPVFPPSDNYDNIFLQLEFDGGIVPGYACSPGGGSDS